MAGCTKLRIGMHVRLKPDVFPFVKIREWKIDSLGKEKILLRCPRNLTLEVSPQDIECD